VFCAVNIDDNSSGGGGGRTFLLILTTLSRVADSITLDDKLILTGRELSLQLAY